MRGGWIRLHRPLVEHRIWLKEPFTPGQAWVDLLLLANYQDSTIIRGNRPMTIHRGQVFTSLETLRTRWRRDRKTVRAWLLLFELEGMLDRATAFGADGGYTLLTIRNYEKYQTRGPGVLDGGTDGDTDGGVGGGTDGAVDGGLDQSKKVEKEKKEASSSATASGPTLAEYRETLGLQGRVVLDQTVAAMATTRKSGKVAQTVLDGFARELAKYSETVVIPACQHYLDRGYAAEGKDERYLLGIVRGGVKRASMNGHRSAVPGETRTLGATLIERAARKLPSASRT